MKCQFRNNIGGKIRDALGVRPRREEVDETRRDEVLLGRGFASDGLRLANAMVVLPPTTTHTQNP
jgi:hypothetical protein